MTFDPTEETINVSYEKHEALESLLKKYTDSKLDCQNIIPGVVAGYANNEKILDLAAAGVLDHGAKERDAPENQIQTDSTFLLWSTTKLLTLTGLFQLIEQGKISLEDPIEKHIPGFKNKKVAVEVNESGVVTKSEDMNIVPQIKHLTTHTCGFSYPFFNEHYQKFMDVANIGGDLLKADKEQFLNLPLVFQPGSKWQYGFNIDVIGLIIEEVTGLTLNDYLKKNIFEKCNMSSFSFVRDESHVKSWVRLHTRDASSTKNFGNITQTPEFTPLNPKTHCGGHGCFGTVKDYLKFLQCFINKGVQPMTGQRILKEETILNDFFSDQLKNIGPNCEFTSLPNPQPLISNPVDVYPTTKKTWSHALLINEDPIDLGDGISRSKNSGMWCGLANLYYVIDMEKKVVLYWGEELFPFADMNSLIGFTEFEKFVYTQVAN